MNYLSYIKVIFMESFLFYFIDLQEIITSGNLSIASFVKYKLLILL